jgi:nitroreductase
MDATNIKPKPGIELSTDQKSIADIIRSRFSCRTYLNQPIDVELKEKIEAFISYVPKGPFGTRARFELVQASKNDRLSLQRLGTYGFIKGATGFLIGATKLADDNPEDFGYLFEKIVLHATSLGLGTCWLGGTFTKSSFAKRISAGDDEIVPAVVSVGYIAEKPRMIERLLRKNPHSKKRLPWEQLFFDRDFGIPLMKEEVGEFDLPLRMVRLAPSASNRQPWRTVKRDNNIHFYLQRTPGYQETWLVRVIAIADLQRIDMGIALSHFELMAEELGLLGHWDTADPDITLPNEWTEYKISWVS